MNEWLAVFKVPYHHSLSNIIYQKDFLYNTGKKVELYFYLMLLHYLSTLYIEYYGVRDRKPNWWMTKTKNKV